MDLHERRLVAFLAGELNESQRREWDEHLISCEPCWSAVREDRLARMATARLRESAPAGLADRIALATEFARSQPRTRRHRVVPSLPLLISACAALAAVVAVLVVALAWPGSRSIDPQPIAAVIQAGQRLTGGAGPGPDQAVASASPVPVGRPATITAGAAHLVLSYYRIGTTQVMVARSDRDFPMPKSARRLPAVGMTWAAERGRLMLYCPGPRVLVVGAMPLPELSKLAAQLPLR